MDRGNGAYASYASRLHFFAADRGLFAAPHRTVRAKGEKSFLAPVRSGLSGLLRIALALGSRRGKDTGAPRAAAGVEPWFSGGRAERVYGDDFLARSVRHPHLLLQLHQGLRQPK